MNRIAILALAMLAAACGKGNEPARDAAAAGDSIPGRPVVLPSGHRVVVQGGRPVRFTKGPPALLVRYVTEVKMTDTATLAAEAAEVFAQFRPTAERARFTGFVAHAVETPTSVMAKEANGYNFVWTRGPDGGWHRN
jgi:hypothetical protein